MESRSQVPPGQTAYLQSEPCTCIPRSLSLRPWAEVFFRYLWRTSSWGKGKPGRHFPPPRVSAQYSSTLDPSFSQFPTIPESTKVLETFVQGSLSSKTMPVGSMGKIEVGKSAPPPALALDLNYCRK